MTMTLTGGVLADNIVWNLNGLGGDVVISSGALVYGNFLAPDRQLVSDHGTVAEGRLIAGGSGTLLSVHSGSRVNNTPERRCLSRPPSSFLALAWQAWGRSWGGKRGREASRLL